MIWVGRLLSLAVAGAYGVMAHRRELTPGDVLPYAIFAFVSLCLIWFPEQAGAVGGMRTAYGLKRVDAESPGCVVAALGWLILLGIPLAYTSLTWTPALR